LDERTNTLIIRDVGESVDRISQLVRTLDKPELQIEIEARIVEATTQFSRQLGAMLGFRIGNSASRYRAGISVLAPIVDPVGSAGVAVGGELDTVFLDAAISAAEANGEARMISKPRVSTLNNTEARIVQGAKIPIPVQMNYTTNVRYETAALHLSVKPRINGEKSVSLEIKVENSVPDFTQTVRDIPTILTSESHTSVVVTDGTTTVIGGIFVESNRKGEIRVPGFSALPVLGRLFRRTDKNVETREILFFITSRIQGGT
jgi:type IV pilus assembly protein PilQ